MIRAYKRKNRKWSWEETYMKNAVSAVVSGEMGDRQASEYFRVPRNTLQYRISRYLESGDAQVSTMKGRGRSRTIFTTAQEQDLVDYFHKLDDRFHGLSKTDLQILTHQLAERVAIEYPSIGEKKSLRCIDRILTRNPMLSLREPQITSEARANDFDRVVVNNFYDVLDIVYKKHNFTADRIYNLNSTTFPALSGNVDTIMTSSTIGLCVSASGHYLPPLFVFPTKLRNSSAMIGAPPKSWSLYHPSGCIQSGILFKWFQWFLKQVEPTRDAPVLLLLDANMMQARNADHIDWVQKRHVVTLFIPLSGTRYLEPLAESVMQPLSIAYSEEIKEITRGNPGEVVTLSNFVELFEKALTKAAKSSTAVEGFRRTGLWPFDHSVIKNDGLELVEVTNQLSPSQKTSEHSCIDTGRNIRRTICPSNRVELFLDSVSATSLSPDLRSFSNQIEQIESSLLQPFPRAEHFDASNEMLQDEPEDAIELEHDRSTGNEHITFKCETNDESGITDEYEVGIVEPSRSNCAPIPRSPAVDSVSTTARQSWIDTTEEDEIRRFRFTENSTPYGQASHPESMANTQQRLQSTIFSTAVTNVRHVEGWSSTPPPGGQGPCQGSFVEPLIGPSTGPISQEQQKDSMDTVLTEERQSKIPDDLDGNDLTYPRVIDDPLVRTVAMVGYPEERIDEDKFNAYRMAMVKVMVESLPWEPLPVCEKTYLSNGLIVTSCKDEESRRRLEELVPHLQPWEGARLEVAGMERLLKLQDVLVWIPGYIKSTPTALMLLGRLNPGFNPGLWTVRNESPVDTCGGRTLLLGVDESSAKIIEARGGKASLGVDFVTFKVLRARSKAHEGYGKRDYSKKGGCDHKTDRLAPK